MLNPPHYILQEKLWIASGKVPHILAVNSSAVNNGRYISAAGFLPGSVYINHGVKTPICFTHTERSHACRCVKMIVSGADSEPIPTSKSYKIGGTNLALTS
jgi:hypothetical protein